MQTDEGYITSGVGNGIVHREKHKPKNDYNF